MAQENRLALEASPYLLQHRHNPVDWFPWGKDALEEAKRLDKPILLSIGYAACHWCHVMERESFEDEAIARRMNELFVNIKVDREERPDLDNIYQTVVQLMGRSGGWPLTVFLTPDARPYFAGTYFPPVDRFGMPGFPRVLDAMAEAYRKQRGDVEEQARELTQAIGRVHASAPKPGEVGIPSGVLETASKKLLSRFDKENGGFGSRPKFPNTMNLDVLLRRGTLEGDAEAKAAVETALDKMRAGGIWDHLRGGFHRYSTDERWLVPHFEKMLYDNALLLRSYVDGYRVFEKERYAETVTSLVEYVFTEMTSREGGFFASQDADSEGHEGKFFVWTPEDVAQALEGKPRLMEVAKRAFGIDGEGNFEESGATVLSEVATLTDEDRGWLEQARQGMLAYRERRPRPLRDDKVLTSWNALFIGALADAGRVFRNPVWVQSAEKAFGALEAGLLRAGRMGRYLKDGAASSQRPGFLDDQSYFGNAALDLYEATGDPRYVSVAKGIARAMIDHHEDKVEGGFFLAPDDGEELIARTKDLFDQAVPSGAAKAALLCMRLAALEDETLLAHAERQLEIAAKEALQNPFGFGETVLAIDTLVRGFVQVVIVGDRKSDKARALADVAYSEYLPHRSIAYVDPSEPASLVAAKVAAEGKPETRGEVVAYVCRRRACSAPVKTPDELRALLRQPA